MVLLFCNGNSKKTLPGCTTGRARESDFTLTNLLLHPSCEPILQAIRNGFEKVPLFRLAGACFLCFIFGTKGADH